MLVIGLIAFAVSAEIIVDEPREPLTATAAALLAGGIMICLVASWGFLALLTGRRRWPWGWRRRRLLDDRPGRRAHHGGHGRLPGGYRHVVQARCDGRHAHNGRMRTRPRIRTASTADLDAIAALEALCFPPAEAADRETIAARLAAYPDHVWLAVEDGPEGHERLVAGVNGMCADLPDLTDEMFSRAELHEPDGAWQMIFSVATAPDRRGRGLAGALVRHAVEDARSSGRRGVVLTAKDALVGFYAHLGFRDEGVSRESTHGGAVWRQMRLIL